MSRIGKKPIVVPSGVEVALDGSVVRVKGPKGELQEKLNAAVTAQLVNGDEGKEIQVTLLQETDPAARAQWGTARALIANMVIGVTRGFSKQLEVNGVGFRVNLQGRALVLTVGFSHEVRVDVPAGVEATVQENVITLWGANKHDVGALADRIRKVRKPEPYKGKGIKYADETIRRKAGKAQKASE